MITLNHYALIFQFMKKTALREATEDSQQTQTIDNEHWVLDIPQLEEKQLSIYRTFLTPDHIFMSGNKINTSVNHKLWPSDLNYPKPLDSTGKYNVLYCL